MKIENIGKYFPDQDIIKLYMRLIFWKKDSIYVRLMIPDIMLTAINLKDLHNDILWKGYYKHIKLDVLIFLF